MNLRDQVLAVAEELRRLKAEGRESVSIADDTLERLRACAGARPAAAIPESEPPAPMPVAPAAREARPEPRPVAAPPPLPAVSGVAPPAGTRPGVPGFELPPGDKRTRWEWLKAFVTGHPECRRHVRPGKQVVLGVGNLDADIFFVGEAPGAEEEVQGEPFVGPAGQLLNKMIQAMGLSRGQVYIGNIMNWRPEMPVGPGGEQVGNRPPTDEEMALCLPFLRAQVEIVQPKLLVALGATAAKGLLGSDRVPSLGSVKGRWHEFAGIPLMVTYHPSYILRSNSNRSKRSIWEDLLQVMERAGLPVTERQRGYFLER